MSVVTEILSKVGDSREIAHYLGMYDSVDPDRRGVIKISGSCLQGDSLEMIAEDLAHLQQLGFIPTVTHGWGAELNDILTAQGIENKFVNGDRYTDEQVMEEVVKIAGRKGEELKQAVKAAGGSADFLGPPMGIVKSKDKNEPEYGSHNGNIVGIDTEPIYDAIGSGMIPIVSPIGTSDDFSKMHNINSASVGSALTKAIDPVKYLMVTSAGGVLNNKGGFISEIVLRKNLQELVDNGVITEGMLKNVEEAAASLYRRESTGDDRSVQIVSPGNLLYELFTHRGKGTFIRTGYEIEGKPVSEVGKEVIYPIVADAFGENLKEGYYQGRCNGNAQVFIEKNGKGLAIVIDGYMDILAVKNGYQRTGLGRDLVDAALKSQDTKKPELHWRTQRQRPINAFYNDLADGRQNFDGPEGVPMVGYWIGLSPAKAHHKLDQMKRMPSNFT